ncbi:MAG: DUF1513 domain-containing protein [Devosia sp.]
MWHRRAFLKAAGAGFAASLLPQQAEALANTELVFASATQRAANSFGAALVTETGKLIASIELPERGHDVTYSPVTGRAVVFARQPGTFAIVFDPAGREAPVTLSSVEGRHFFGHGVFSPDGRLLYATENDFENARGVIGIYAVGGGYKRIGEFDTYGIGPHEILLMPDGETFAIANGGIETHPDYGRQELNIDTMEPSLAFVRVGDGSLVGQLRLTSALHQLSIRHMAVDRQDRVWFGCQFRGAAEMTPQLLGYATLDGHIRLIELPAETLRDLRNYVGSVAASADGSLIAVSSPEGDTILAIEAESARSFELVGLKSGCGLAPDRKGFVASSGLGAVMGFAGSDASGSFDFGFDNHLRRLPL